MIALRAKALLRSAWTADRVARNLIVLSILYLALPHLIFYVSWLRWPLGVIAVAALIVAVNETRKSVWQPTLVQSQLTLAKPTVDSSPTELQEDSPGLIFTRQDAWMIGALCMIWLTLAGVGGFVSQDLDWNKHNTVLNSLMLKPWPTVYEIYKVDVPLVYYIAYYLPAALVGKVGGWLWMNVALFGWSLIGLVIAVLWFCLLVGRRSFGVLLTFIFFSGLDVIGKALANYGVWNIVVRDWQHIDSWASLWQYSSNATLLNWVPPQAIGGWVVTGMMLYCLVTLRRRELLLLPFGLSALWSPFITVGVLPFLVIDFLVDKEPRSQRLRQMISLPNVVGVLVVALTGFYYSAKMSAGSPVVIQSLLGGLSITEYAGSALDAVAFLLIFCLLEFGFYVIILYRSGAVQDERWRWLFDITVLTLCILPWYKLGVYNDLVMRASIPALFLLAVVVTRAVFNQTLARQTRIALLVLLLVGAITPGIEFKRHFQRMATLPAPIFDEAAQRWDFVYYMRRQTFFFGQYAGSIDSPFFQLAAKPIPAVNVSTRESEENEMRRHDYLLYGEQLYLVRDMATLPPEIGAGQTMTVTVPIHFFGPLNMQPYDPVLRVSNAAGEVAAARDGWPVARPEISPFWMTQWSGEFTLTVPITTTPGLYTLEVGFVGSNDGEFLVAHSVPAGEVIGEVVPITTTVVVAAD